jgi:hypothetical protein
MRNHPAMVNRLVEKGAEVNATAHVRARRTLAAVPISFCRLRMRVLRATP